MLALLHFLLLHIVCYKSLFQSPSIGYFFLVFANSSASADKIHVRNFSTQPQRACGFKAHFCKHKLKDIISSIACRCGSQAVSLCLDFYLVVLENFSHKSEVVRNFPQFSPFRSCCKEKCRRAPFTYKLLSFFFLFFFCYLLLISHFS